MMCFRAAMGLGVALGLAVPVAAARTPGLVYPAMAALPSGDEMNLDRLLSIYEDLGAALANVENVKDADMVAARVAVDFLLLRGMDKALTEATRAGSHVSADFMASFKTRREQVGTAVETAINRLREVNCYGSEALPAALSLSGLIAGQSRPAHEAETAVQELLVNNLEMVATLLEMAVDAESAALVASLVESATQCKSALAAYSQEIGCSHLDKVQLDFYAGRRAKATTEILLLSQRLEEADYYGCRALRNCVEEALHP